MPLKSKFNPERVSISEYKFLKGQVEGPEDFIPESVESFDLENRVDMAFNVDDKMVRVDFFAKITTQSKGKNKKEASGNFHFVFIYKVDNLEELATPINPKLINVDDAMGIALTSITYSTSRGILLTRLQGTPLQNFILPVVNPNNLFEREKTK